MPRIVRPFAVALAALAAALTLAPAAQAAQAKAPIAPPLTPGLLSGLATAAAPGDMVIGSPAAKVTVVEYASVMCPHCARFNAEVFPAFKAKYLDTGKVRYVFREFPTQPAELAAAGFMVARCAPANKYFAVLDALFRGQTALFEKQDAKQYLVDAGRVGGLTAEQVMTCVEDKAGIEAFNQRYQNAVDVAKVEATPTFLIGASKLEGEQSLAALDAVIQPLLAAR